MTRHRFFFRAQNPKIEAPENLENQKVKNRFFISKFSPSQILSFCHLKKKR
jgi:hypothetical protein